MDRTETLKIMAVIKAAYPRYYGEGSNVEDAIGLWQLAFSKDSYSAVSMAVIGFIKADTKGFPPHIGAISHMLHKLKNGTQLTEQEAWYRVYSAVCNSAYNAKQEFDALPTEVRQVVGSPKQLQDWSQMDKYAVNTVVASNFQRSYREKRELQAEISKAPELAGTAKMQIGDGECD